MLTLLYVILVLVAIGMYFVFLGSETCPQCGTELGISVGGVRTKRRSCVCGWRDTSPSDY